MHPICRISLTGILLLIHFVSVCQQNPVTDADFDSMIIQPYIRDHALYKEQVYLHFNKSCYLPGDDIWFSAYILDPMTGKLNPYTKNLYVELYNERGKLQEQKILPVNTGLADNMFKLREDSRPGKYTIRAYTTWMKNFAAAEEIDIPLEVIGEKQEEKITPAPEYDIQFFAESGTLLEGIFNKVAVKAVDPNGRAAVLKGVVLDEKNDTLASVQLNKTGMGLFILNPVKTSVYKAKFRLPDGREQIVNLPAVEDKGVIVSVNTFKNNKFGIEVTTNAQTIGKEQTFYLLMHSNGNVFQAFTVRLAPEKSAAVFSVDHCQAGKGVNCLTVFNENDQPVAERLFYNPENNLKGELDLRSYTESDSTQFQLSIHRDSVMHRLTNLSISVLPQGTVSDHFTNSLLAEVLLKSGVRGPIQNPHYFIEKTDPEHLVAMDLLLLTQGWRKYDWKNLNRTNRKYTHPFDNGFSIEGQVKNWLNGKQDPNGSVSIVSPENKLFSVGKADSTGRYSFKGLYLMDSTQVIVSASNVKGKNWNRTLTAFLVPDYTTDSLITVKPQVALSSNIEAKTETPLKLMPGVIQLPEFVITAEVKKPFEHSVYVSSFDKSVEVTKDKYLRYGTIENLLRTEFNVRVEIDPEGNYQIDMGRAQKTAKPKLIIDDIEATDMSFLSTYTLDQIEAISVNKDGNAITGDGGAIIIQIRKEAINWGSGTATNLKRLFIRGFAPAVQYYTPKYLQVPESETYQKYAAIYWKPDVVIDSTGVAILKFGSPVEIKNIRIRIEGIADDGTVFLDERTVKIRKEN